MTVTADLVGRDAQLGELETLLAEAAGGRQRTALVCGEPGIGKTALTEALAGRAREAGFRTVWGRCWEGSGAPAYWPWAQVVRSCLGNEATSLFGDDPLRVEPATEEDRSRLFDEVTERILAIAAPGLLIALDDLQAADEGSLQLLRFLARADATTPLLLVGTYRPSEVARSPSHQTALSAVARYGPTIRLRGLDRDGVGVLLDRAGAGVDRKGAYDVHRVTEGNPFLVYEAARLLGNRPGAALPAEAGEVVGARLDALGHDLRSLLTAAAVVGREFSLGVLSRVVDCPPDDLLDSLTHAEKLVVLEEVELGRWSFSHALLRDALLKELDDERRQCLHRRAGEVLQVMHETDPASVPEIAHHLAEGCAPGAGDMCARAGEIALAGYAFEDAARWFRRAIHLLPDDQERRRYDLFLALGAALLAVGNEPDARQAHRLAIRAARALGSTELAAEAAVRVAPISVSDAAVIGALDDALCDLPEEDSALRARVLVSFAAVMQASSVSRVVLRQVSAQGRDMARRVGDGETLWSVLWQWRLDAAGKAETLDERMEVVGELVAIAEAAGDRRRLLLANQAKAETLFEAGRIPAARGEAERCLETARALHQARSTLAAIEVLFGIALVEGRHDDAELLCRQASEVSRHSQDEDSEMNGHVGLSGLRRHQGRFAEVEQLCREAMERWTVTGVDCTRLIPRVIALAELGRTKEAATLLESFVGDEPVRMTFGMRVPDIGWVEAPRLCCPTALAEACCLLEDRTRAAALYDALLPSAELHISSGRFSRGFVARYLGNLAALLGRDDEADAHFRLAHRLHDAMDAPIWSAHGRLDHGRMLMAGESPWDRQQAAELLAEARDRFEALGMEFYRHRAAELLERCRLPLPASICEEDGQWVFVYAGRSARLRDGKGVRFLVRLLREPGRELHALELTEDGQDAERARQSVTRALKTTVDRLDGAHPDLGAHLRTALRIGVYSAYVPDPRAPTTWTAD